MELLVLVLLLLLAVWGQNYVYGRWAFSRLEYDCSFSREELTEGEKMEFTEVVSNRKLLPLPWLKAEITTSKWLELSQLQSVVTDRTRFLSSFFMLQSYRRVRRSWQVTCLKRGVFQIDKVVLVSTDLIGGLLLSLPVKVRARVTVLPRPLSLPESFCAPDNTMGEQLVRRQLLPDPFWRSGVRDYTGREPMKCIHWPATAREGHLMVYQEDYTAQLCMTVILNMQTHPFWAEGAVLEERLEDAIRTCAALFEEGLSMGAALRFLSNTPSPIETDACERPEDLLPLLRMLSGMELLSGEHFPHYLNRIFYRIPRGDLALVSCYADEPILEFARRMAGEGNRVQLYLLDPSASIREEEFEVYRIKGAGR